MPPRTNSPRTATRFGLIASLLFTFAIPVNQAFSQTNRTPSEPLTGKYTVQWFNQSKNECVVSIYSPLNYQDGVRISTGADVKMKFYRSYDGGKTYGTKGVHSKKQTYIYSKDPTTGQPKFDPAKISWISCVLEIPVDPPKPQAIELFGERADGTKADAKESTVYLAVAAVVDGVESKKTSKFLTFTYASGGKPTLLRYETPDRTDHATPTSLVNVPAQVLADRGGLWEGNLTMTTYSLPDKLTSQPGFSEFAKLIDAGMSKALGKPKPVKFKVTSMTADLGKSDKSKNAFFGTADFTGANDDDPTKSTTSKMNVIYYRNRSLVIFENATEEATLELTGHVFENATEYELHGVIRIGPGTKPRKGSIPMIIHGLLTVKQEK